DTTVNTGDGANTVIVSSQARNLDDIDYYLHINGGGAATDLVFNDQANPYRTSTANRYEIGNSLGLPPESGSAPRPRLFVPESYGIGYANIRNLVLNPGAGHNVITVDDTGAAFTRFDASSSLANVLGTTGALEVDGGTLVTLGDGTLAKLHG